MKDRHSRTARRSVWLNSRDLAYLNNKGDWAETPEDAEHINAKITEEEYQKLLAKRMCAYMTEQREPVCVSLLPSMLFNTVATLASEIPPNQKGSMTTVRHDSNEAAVQAEGQMVEFVKGILLRFVKEMDHLKRQQTVEGIQLAKVMEKEADLYGGTLLNLIHAKLLELGWGKLSESRIATITQALAVTVVPAAVAGYFNLNIHDPKIQAKITLLTLVASALKKDGGNHDAEWYKWVQQSGAAEEIREYDRQVRENQIRFLRTVFEGGDEEFLNVVNTTIFPLVAGAEAQREAIKMIIYEDNEIHKLSDDDARASKYDGSMITFRVDTGLLKDQLQFPQIDEGRNELIKLLVDAGVMNITNPPGMYPIRLKNGKEITVLVTYSNNPHNEELRVALQLRNLVYNFNTMSRANVEQRMRQLPINHPFPLLKRLFEEEFHNKTTGRASPRDWDQMQDDVQDTITKYGFGPGSIDNLSIYQHRLIQGIAFVCHADPNMRYAVDVVFGTSPAQDGLVAEQSSHSISELFHGYFNKTRALLKAPIYTLKSWNKTMSFQNVLDHLRNDDRPQYMKSLENTRFLMAAGLYMQVVGNDTLPNVYALMDEGEQHDRTRREFTKLAENATMTKLMSFVMGYERRVKFKLVRHIANRYYGPVFKEVKTKEIEDDLRKLDEASQKRLAHSQHSQTLDKIGDIRQQIESMRSSVWQSAGILGASGLTIMIILACIGGRKFKKLLNWLEDRLPPNMKDIFKMLGELWTAGKAERKQRMQQEAIDKNNAALERIARTPIRPHHSGTGVHTPFMSLGSDSRSSSPSSEPVHNLKYIPGSDSDSSSPRQSPPQD